MYKLFFIARNNMKKQKGDMITFFILTLFAAFLIFDAASAIPANTLRLYVFKATR